MPFILLNLFGNSGFPFGNRQPPLLSMLILLGTSPQLKSTKPCAARCAGLCGFYVQLCGFYV